MAREILGNRDLPDVLNRAKAIIKTGFNAGDGYGDVWIREFATFIVLSCEVGDRAEVRKNLLMFFRFQGDDGNIIDGFIPASKGNVAYRYIRKPNVPGWCVHLLVKGALLGARRPDNTDEPAAATVNIRRNRL